MKSRLSAWPLGLALSSLVLPGAAQAGARFDWMIGRWVHTEAAATTSETWQETAPGTLSGIGRTERPGRATFEERMTIQSSPTGATFTAEFPGQPATSFLLKSGRPGVAVFVNKAHDFPQRVIYRRCGQDLCARIEGVMDGKPASESWRYQRVR
jgi:Domain of unknown function (DUF6265)